METSRESSVLHVRDVSTCQTHSWRSWRSSIESWSDATTNSSTQTWVTATETLGKRMGTQAYNRHWIQRLSCQTAAQSSLPLICNGRKQAQRLTRKSTLQYQLSRTQRRKIRAWDHDSEWNDLQHGCCESLPRRAPLTLLHREAGQNRIPVPETANETRLGYTQTEVEEKYMPSELIEYMMNREGQKMLALVNMRCRRKDSELPESKQAWLAVTPKQIDAKLYSHHEHAFGTDVG